MAAHNHNPRPVLLAAAIWNYVAAAAGLLIAISGKFAGIAGLKRSVDSFAWELFAACALAFGIGYHWTSKDAPRHRDLIKLGTMGKPLVFAAAVWNFYRGAVPAEFVLGSAVDLLFGAYFLWFLMKTREPVLEVSQLESAPYLAIPKIVLDVLLWASAGYLIYASSSLALILLLAFLAGLVPLHDLLVQGHEGTHGLISRVRWVNELLGWFTLAPVFISCAAHRAFHMRHHEAPHAEGDPEYEFFNRIVPGVPGWAFLLIPAGAPVAVNLYALRSSSDFKLRLRIVAELTAAAALHLAIAWTLGLHLYAKVILLPMATGLPVASFLRAIAEHHATARGDDWKTARSVRTNRVLEFFWSNVNYHLEHHLYPGVPYHKLPGVKELLGTFYAEHHANISQGYLRTAAALIREPKHFKI